MNIQTYSPHTFSSVHITTPTKDKPETPLSIWVEKQSPDKNGYTFLNDEVVSTNSGFVQAANQALNNAEETSLATTLRLKCLSVLGELLNLPFSQEIKDHLENLKNKLTAEEAPSYTSISDGSGSSKVISHFYFDLEKSKPLD